MSYIESTIGTSSEIKTLAREIWAGCEHLTTENGEMLVNVQYDRLLGWLDRGEKRWRKHADELEERIASQKRTIMRYRDEARELREELDAYEAKMDALLSRLTNGTWSKTREYDIEFMVSCVNEEFEECYNDEIAGLQTQIDNRDKGIARLKRQRDEAREQVAALDAAPSAPQGRDCQPMSDLLEECGEYERIADETVEENAMLRDRLDGALALLAKLGEFDENLDIEDPDYYARCWAGHVRTIGRLQHELKRAEAERDALARDLADCNRQREDLRDRLGIAIDYAHDVIELVNLDAK